MKGNQSVCHTDIKMNSAWLVEASESSCLYEGELHDYLRLLNLSIYKQIQKDPNLIILRSRKQLQLTFLITENTIYMIQNFIEEKSSDCIHFWGSTKLWRSAEDKKKLGRERRGEEEGTTFGQRRIAHVWIIFK
jgi:hypothetical protein